MSPKHDSDNFSETRTAVRYIDRLFRPFLHELKKDFFFQPP